MSRLSWLTLGSVPEGTRVIFAEPHDIFPETVVASGTLGVIIENNLNESWGALRVLPDNEALRTALNEWNGCIHLGSDLGPEGPDVDPRWLELSPLEIVTAQT